MGETRLQRESRMRARDIRRATGEAVRRLREDAGLTCAAVAEAAGLHPSYIGLIERGERAPGIEALTAIAAVLGSDLSVRLFPTTGPRIHDRIQAAMEEALLRVLHARWIASPEVPVVRPARGVRGSGAPIWRCLAASGPGRDGASRPGTVAAERARLDRDSVTVSRGPASRTSAARPRGPARTGADHLTLSAAVPAPARHPEPGRAAASATRPARSPRRPGPARAPPAPRGRSPRAAPRLRAPGTERP